MNYRVECIVDKTGKTPIGKRPPKTEWIPFRGTPVRPRVVDYNGKVIEKGKYQSGTKEFCESLVKTGRYVWVPGFEPEDLLKEFIIKEEKDKEE